MYKLTLAILLASVLSVFNIAAQTPGILVRSAGTPVSMVSDPKAYGYTATAVKENACKVTTHTPAGAIDAAWPLCSSGKGMAGTKVANASVKIYKLGSAGYELFAADVPVSGNKFLVTYSNGITGTRWQYDGGASPSADPCNGGTNDIPEGAYAFVSELAPGCVSAPTMLCGDGGAGAPITPTPVITSLLTDGAATINGTSTGDAVSLFINDYFVQAVPVTGGKYTFTLTAPWATGADVKVYASTDLQCLSAAAGGKISCYIAAPVINTLALKQVGAGSQLTGSATPNTTVTIYNAATMVTIGAPVRVTPTGTWTLTTSTVVAGTDYISRITAGSCGISALSDTAKGTAATLATSTAGDKFSPIQTLRPGKGIVLSHVSPNPFTESVQIRFDAASASKMTLRIVDMMGRPVKTNSFISNKGVNTIVTAGLSGLAAGIYIIELSADGERVYKQQLLKK